VAGRGLAEVAGTGGFFLPLGRRFWRLTLTDSDGIVSASWEIVVKMGTVGDFLKFCEEAGGLGWPAAGWPRWWNGWILFAVGEAVLETNTN
jgi:hypothetical protein